MYVVKEDLGIYLVVVLIIHYGMTIWTIIIGANENMIAKMSFVAKVIR